MASLPASSPPAIVAGCSAVRRDGAQGATSQVLGAVAGAAISGTVQGVGYAAAQTAADATVSTDVAVAFESESAKTIVGLRLGVALDNGGFQFIDVETTIAPNGDAMVQERLARGPVQIGVSSCRVLRVTFADGTVWRAPLATPAPR
jgi:hypothetical protein